MSFRPCILIPIYNHGDTIADSIEKVRIYGLPIFIIDDGSDDATKKSLTRISAAYPEVHYLVRKDNGGKGAALKMGFRAALKHGFTHALQIDADGQHNMADIPRFLALGKKYPEGLICGAPVYDSSVPKSRLYGRRITNFWIVIETLSFEIPDAMCGFRLYPLNKTVSLIDTHFIGNRMEFDIEILVRFAWSLLPIQWIKTEVSYPEGGRSNFRLFRDNVLISWAHARLVSEMILHIPKLLTKHFKSGYSYE